MMLRTRKALTLKVGASLLALIITAIGGAISTKLVDVQEWQIWDFFVTKEPLDGLVVLSPQLQYDETGVLTARIRIALEKLGVRYRTIDREFPALPPVVPSGEVTDLIIRQGEQLLKHHGGDVIVYGSAGIAKGQVFLRLFIKSDCGCLHGATPFDLTSDDWQATLKAMIELVMTAGLGTQYRTGKWLKSGLPLSHSMRIWENKFGKLADLIEDDVLKVEAVDLEKHAKLTRMKIEGDGSGIGEFRRQSTETLSVQLSQCKKNPGECDIRRELLFLADLGIYDGLINGVPERIQEGLSLALLAGRDAMDREIVGDPNVLRAPMQSRFVHWLSMANLILACEDKKDMDRFVDQLNAFLSENTKREGFREGDVERMLWPMLVLKRNVVSKTVLENHYRFLSQHPYFGFPKPDYWQDPFLHAKRSIQRRLQRMSKENGAHLDSRFWGQSQCSSLSEWMKRKGW